MSATKWTPGPWTAIHSSWETSLVNGHPDYGYTVAVCPIHCDVSEDDQAEYESVKDANANLIAAAPDLYEAVRTAEQLAQVASDWNLDEVEIDGEMVPTYKLLDEFTAALAKARGEPQNQEAV